MWFPFSWKLKQLIAQNDFPQDIAVVVYQDDRFIDFEQ